MSDTQPADRATALQALANRYYALFRRCGRPDLAASLERIAQQWKAATVTVVVCGEVNSGKSTLINALLDQPDLLPAHADAATTAQVVIRHAPHPAVVVTRWSADGDRINTGIDPSHTADNDSPDGGRLEGASRIDIGLDHPLLAAGLTLVDTPGFGSLDAGHRDLTVAMVEHADIVIFVAAAERPLLRSELEFMERCLETTGSVVNVLNRVDLVSDPDLAASEFTERLTQFAQGQPSASTTSPIRGRLVERLAATPPITVSARLATRALRIRADGSSDGADRLLDESGLRQLAVLVEQFALEPAAMRRSRLASALTRLAAAARTSLLEQATDVPADEEAERLRALRRELDELASAAARWRGVVAADCQRLQTAADRRLASDLASLETQLKAELTSGKPDTTTLRQIPPRVEASLQAAWLNAAAFVAEGLEELQRRLADELLLPMPTAEMSGFSTAAATLRPLDEPAKVGAHFDFVDHGLPTATSTMFISGLAATFLGPVGLVVGAATSGALLLARLTRQSRRQTTQALTQSISQALREARHDLTGDLHERLLDARRQLEMLIDSTIVERREAISERRAGLERDLKLASAERTAQRSAAARLLAALDDLDTEREMLTSRSVQA